jgi:hypothetical protein
MSRVRATGAVSILLLAASSISAIAQIPSPRGVGPSCSYVACAVRVEPAFLGSGLVVGAAGDSVTRLGPWGGGVGILLAGPDSAAAYAHKYTYATRRATVLGLLATASYVALLWRTDSFRDEMHGADAALAVAGIGFAIGTIPFTLQSQRSLSRSVWWYNAALAR